jgi:hypothetical protein
MPYIFYYTLGNIRPENRSHKNAVQLLGLILCKHLKKCGAGALLDLFKEDLAKLEQVSKTACCITVLHVREVYTHINNYSTIHTVYHLLVFPLNLESWHYDCIHLVLVLSTI